MRPSAFSSPHLKELSATWPMTVSPLIHSPGLISASALENDPTPQDLTLGAWRSLPGRTWWVRALKCWGFFVRLFFHLLTALTAPSAFSETPAPQSARPSRHWMDGCSEPHITRQPRPFSESRSRLKSGGWAGETGTQPSQCFQEPRLCATYGVSQPMKCTVTVCEMPLPRRQAKQKQNLGKQRNDFSQTNGWWLNLIRNKRTWELFLVSSGSGPEKGLECVSGSRIKEGFFRATLETWGWGEDGWEPETQTKGWGSEDWQGGKGPRQQGPGGTAIWLWSRGLWKVSWCSEGKARGFPVPGNRVNENLSLGHGFWNFP